VGFTKQALTRFEGLEVGPDPQVPEDAEELLAYCGVHPADGAAMLAARPDPDREPEWWAITWALAGEVERDLDLALPSTGFRGWPAVPRDASPTGLFAPAWALLANLPRLCDLHEQRGVPESVTVATVSALGGVMGTHRHIFGCAGVGLMPLWGPPLRFRGADYEIGRHDFTRTHMGLGDGVSGHVLSIHIPPIGPLDAVFIRAPRFRALFPDVEVLGRYAGEPVLVRQGRVVAATFHPELTGSRGLHRYLAGVSQTAAEAKPRARASAGLVSRARARNTARRAARQG